MKKIVTTAMALFMAASMTACGSLESSSDIMPGANISDASFTDKMEAETTMNTNEIHGRITGGWTAISGNNSPGANLGAKAAFEKAVSTLAGMEYEPLAVLASQIVSGTNYCILCRGRATVPDPAPSVVLVYVYKDLKGNAEIIGTKTIISDEQLDGGWYANDGDTDIEQNADLKKAFDKVAETLTGAELEPVAYLGSQSAAGSDHLLLCKITASVPGAETGYAFVTLFIDLDGNAEITEISDISFGEYDGTYEEETEEHNKQADYETFVAENN